MTINLQKLAFWLIVVGIYLTPILSLQELLSLFTGNLTSQTTALSSVYVKGLKDVLLILLLFIGLLNFVLFHKKINRKVTFIFLLISGSVAISTFFSINNSYIFTFSGLRWAVPVLLPFFIFPLIDLRTINKIAKALLLIFALHFLLQIVQLFFLGGWFGRNFLGLSARNPGLFLIPNTAAFFTISVFFVNIFLTEMKKNHKRLLIITSLLSVLLTASGTGFVVWIVLFIIMYLNKGLFSATPLILLFSIPIVFYAMTFALQRGDEYLAVSGGTRLDIFLGALANAGFISSQFGFGTNTAILLGEGIITDSMFASVTINLGIFGLLVFVFLLISFGIKALYEKSRHYLAFVIIMALFSATTIVTEAYPMNMTLAVVAAYYLRMALDEYEPAYME